VGAGFSSIENFIATAQVQQANLFGTGQSLALQGQISGLRQLIDLRFFEPYFFDSDFSFSSTCTTSCASTTTSHRLAGRCGDLGYTLSRPETAVTLTYTGEYDKVSTVSARRSWHFLSGVGLPPSAAGEPVRDGFTSSVSPAIRYDTRTIVSFHERHLHAGSVELARPTSGRRTSSSATTGRALLLPIGGGSSQAQHLAGYVTSPDPQAFDLRTLLPGGIFDVRASVCAPLARLPLASRLDRTLRRSPTARTSAAT